VCEALSFENVGSIKRPRAVTVVGRKGAMGKKGTKIVDKRMKKDHVSTCFTRTKLLVLPAQKYLLY
jgi:putative NADH-flavin reductase